MLSLWDNEMKEAVTKVIDTLTQEDFHGAFQELLERYNKFHVCTINKSAHTKKRLETYWMILVYLLVMKNATYMACDNSLSLVCSLPFSGKRSPYRLSSEINDPKVIILIYFQENYKRKEQQNSIAG